MIHPRVFQDLAKTNVARHCCTFVERTGIDIKRFPKRTVGRTTSPRSEGNAGTTAQITPSQLRRQ